MEYTRPTPGSLFFNEDGVAGCPKCGWRGIPTFTGGRTARISSILSFADRRRKASHPVPADVDHRCPSCEHEPDPPFHAWNSNPFTHTHRRRPKATAKRRAAKAARRRNR